MLSDRDYQGRVALGLGFFFLCTSLMPAGFFPLLRLAGFSIDRVKGKAHLTECVEKDIDLGPRATLACLLLSMYHLDIEPDLPRAGDLLVSKLGLQPENVLLHWAGSMLAWRNTCIQQAGELTRTALWCCGEQLGSKAIFLRYELGLFHFVSMSWWSAYNELRYVWDAATSSGHQDDKNFFPYKAIVGTQLAAVAFSLGRDEEAAVLSVESAAAQERFGLLRMEGDFTKVLEIFLRHRARGRSLFAFEVMYFFRQFPKVPTDMLEAIQFRLEDIARPFGEDVARERRRLDGTSGAGAAEALQSPLAEESLVGYASARVVLCVVLFYLGDLDRAMEVVPELSQICSLLPAWSTYLAAHGWYWCGRVLDQCGRRGEALDCLKRGKALKKYPFGITEKMGKMLAQVERAHARSEAAP
ncbi:unnamed protein product [Prorocentrum cordatum]|uniref:Tetratricopeptide repeat protein 38 n=1 Tax=Prorocentrum cordatum TaxID=2364126 RepID=A0ABN9THM9_9DINO|nr:unnamed protein product [Polarella glacialis]